MRRARLGRSGSNENLASAVDSRVRSVDPIVLLYWRWARSGLSARVTNVGQSAVCALERQSDEIRNLSCLSRESAGRVDPDA